ncbi:lariat debranching enzyme [Coemansia brasiliensis]|uniref:Lariat debranching enzyme n=1 Tax=Coemansia brasiliensis TaxID=2650707 RepID=A0A9W8LZP9_9FUNG|nr:lariat debranching enzyme [Coemansia brasiliensis]
MSCPDKYKQIGGFYRYYSGEKTAPIPTIFVGGNHEAGNHSRELYYGGWVAKNIYFLGNSGVVKFGGLRIGGISGIFKDFDYHKGYYEHPPFRGHSRSSMHHVRSYEAFKMLQIRQPLDIVISHDWPQYIERYGDTEGLLKKKPFFKKEVDRGDLGSPVNAMLLEKLRPAWWLSAHLHVRFTAKVDANESIFPEGWAGIAPCPANISADSKANPANTDEITISDEEFDFNEPSNGAQMTKPETKKHSSTTPAKAENTADKACRGPTQFLALDKCLPRRQFLEIIEVEAPHDAADEELKLEYDPEWLAILRLCHPYMPLDETPFNPPVQGAMPLFPNELVDKEMEWVMKTIFVNGQRYIPENFVPVAPVPPPGTPDTANFGIARDNRGRGPGYERHGQRNIRNGSEWPGPQPYFINANPQTEDFCKMLGVQDQLTQRLR